MGTFKPQEEFQESFLPFSMYCGNIHRNEAGFWEQIYKINGMFPEARTILGPFPEGPQVPFPEEYISHSKEQRNEVKAQPVSGIRNLCYCFFIVSNKGYLFGDYDKEQRL